MTLYRYEGKGKPREEINEDLEDMSPIDIRYNVGQ